MTKQERKLWFDFLKDLPVKIYKQKLVGNYILDFYCDKYKIAIELDGNQHCDNIESIKKDEERTKYLNSIGIRVIRYSNYDINDNFETVCQDILKEFGML